MNFLSSFVMFILLSSCKPSKIVSTKLSPPVFESASNLKPHMRFSHVPCGVACVRNTFASLGSELHCITETLFKSLQLYWTPQAAHHPITVLLLALAAVTVPRRDPPIVIFTRISVAERAHVRQCDSSLSLLWQDDPPEEVRALLHDLLAPHSFVDHNPASHCNSTR